MFLIAKRIYLISFNSPVAGVGFDTFDYFGATALTIEAFTGANGTGTSLGSFNSVTQNFQPNNLYFMGLVSTDGDISSLVFTNPAGGGDSVGIDDIVFATAVPFEFSPTLGLLLIGAGVGAERWWRSRRRQEVSLEENA